MAAPMSSCLRDTSSVCSPIMMNKSPESQFGEQSTATNLQWEKAQRDTWKINPAVPIPVVDKKIQCTTQDSTTSLDQVTSRSNSHFRVLLAQLDTIDSLSKQNVNIELSSTKSFVDHNLESEQCMEEKTKCVALSIDKKHFSERELMVPVSTASGDETSVYTSKMKLGPLCHKGSSVSYVPSRLQVEALIETTVRIPSTITSLSSFPQYSSISGMPSLLHTQDIVWPDNRRMSFPKLPSKRLPLLLYSDYVNSLDITEIAEMVSITPPCCRISSIPGFPSVLERVPNMAGLLPTCAKISKVPGLVSLQLGNSYERNVCERGSLWKKTLRIKEEFLSRVSCVQEHTADDSNVDRCMGAILPTCARKASVPGFPSAPLQMASYTPSMTSLLPTCPKQTLIAGIPFRQNVRSYNDNWHVLVELILDAPLRSSPILFQEKPHKDTRYEKHMVNMLPSCPCKAALPGFPSVPQKEHSVLDVLFSRRQDSRATCPRKYNVTNPPSKEPVSAQVESLNMGGHVTMEKNFYQNTTNIINFVPMCPKQTQTPGMPCHFPKTYENKDWHALRRVINNSLEKNTQVYVVQWTPEDTILPKDMVNLLNSCPVEAKVFGLPFAPQLKPRMVNIVYSCPRHSGISGLPSWKRLSSCKEWFTSQSLKWKIPCIKKEVKILNATSCVDTGIAENMCALLPSCPEHAKILGFSSLTQRLLDSSTVVNVLPSCTKESSVPGMPPNVTKQFESLMERQGLLLPREMSVAILHLEDVKMYSFNSDVIINMVSVLPTCPRHSRIYGIPFRVSESVEVKWIVDNRPVWEKPLKNPGKLPLIYHHGLYFREMSAVRIMLSMLPPCPKHPNISGIPFKVEERTSAVQVLPKEAPSMLKCLATLPEHGKIHGLPAKNCAKICDDWYVDRDGDCEPSFNTRCVVVCQDFKNEEMSHNDKEIMLSMFALCPRQTLIHGFPSVSRSQAVATVEKDMVQLLPCCPRKSNIIGFPSIISNSNVGGGTDVITKTQDCTAFAKRCGSYKDVMKNLLLFELSSPNILKSSLIAVPDINQFSNMVNIISSCLMNASILGLPSTHMHHSGRGWPIEKTLLAKSGIKITGKEGQIMSQHLSLEQQFIYDSPVQERSPQFHARDVPDYVQQRMTIESSQCPSEVTVKDFLSSCSEIQVDKPASEVNGIESSMNDTSPIRLDFDLKKSDSNVCSPVETQKDGHGLWIPIDAEEVAVLEKG